MSSDSDLCSLIEELRACTTSSLTSQDDIINLVVQKTAIYVGERLLNQECLLLLSVKQTFSNFVSNASHSSQLPVEQNVTARWLLSNLTERLQHHMSYNCRIKKHGTLLHRNNGDLLTTISHLLYKSASVCGENESNVSVCTHASEPQPTTTASVFDDINSRLHQQIQRFLAADLKAPYPVHAINIATLVSDIDPQLWTFIRSITRSISERKEYTAKTHQSDSPEYHVKQLQCVFCICAIMFCTDDRCSIPFHTMITDTIESCGGSSQLIRILNRLGVCSSADTLARTIQCRVKERERVGPEEECSPHTPTIISVDNIDFQHSYAQVFCGQQTSSWHGTTVQAVQPKLSTTHEIVPAHRVENGASPKRSTLSHGECTAAGTSDVHASHRQPKCIASENLLSAPTRKRCISTRSPFKAPRSPIPKFKRRARTGMEEKSTASPLPPTQIPVLQYSSSIQRLPNLQVELSANEISTIAQFQKEMDMYTFVNYILSKNDTAAGEPCLLRIQDYMSVVCPITVQKSNIVYMQVLDAKSENKDTLMTIMFDLHQRFIKQQGKQFMVLTADAKLYEVLQSLKHEYGEELSWVLPYLGIGICLPKCTD